ncbi:The fantastic four family [Macleaya cordata]|uniref:The fantastic four family n=1 Tax=Macleaya cordata TaxID=56857 RepID=A0A200Q9N6_MACCD|nr:The fantastic four family [Macleaya cordata]
MSTSVNNKGLPSEPLQGIGSILGSEFERPKSAAASLRRTLSADMSSKKWLTQHGFSPLKKIASSEELQIEVSDHHQEQNKKDLEEQPGQFDIWCSILSQKPSSLPPPYVHPLVKRSKSSLSGKSLEICTENLGSESGSDGFSSYPSSEISDNEEQDEEVVEAEKESDILVEVEKQEMGVVNYSCSVSRKSPPRSFPPPLPSLSRPGGLHMKPHRKDGRLVLEAVPVPSSHSYFHAQRQDGRLLLTFIKSPSQETNIEKDFEDEIEDEEIEVAENEVEEFDDTDDEEEEEDEEPMMENRGIVLEMSNKVPKVPTGVINVHRSALMVNKFMGLTNNRNNPTCWSDHQKKFEKMVKQVDKDHGNDFESSTLVPQSLPSPPPPRPPQPRMSRLIPSPPPPPVGAASFNSYEYGWRRTSSSVVSVSGIHHPLNQQSLPNTKNNYCNNNYSNSKNNCNTITTTNNNNNNFLVISRNSLSPSSSKDYNKEKQQLVVLSGEKGDHLVPYLRGCKEPRRSLLIWEPYCIATS